MFLTTRLKYIELFINTSFDITKYTNKQVKPIFFSKDIKFLKE